MSPRKQLLSDSYLATAQDGVHSEPGNVEGCALEIKKRKGRMRGFFRYNNTKIGDKNSEGKVPRFVRLPLGSYSQGLRELRRQCGALEELVEQGKSPQRYRQQVKDKLRAAGMTLREALDEFWPHALKKIWAPSTARQSAQVRRLHLDKLSIMDMPIDSIRADHIVKDMGEKWATQSGNGERMRSLCHSAVQFQIDKDDGVFRGPNVFSWRKTSSLSIKLGPPPPEQVNPGVHWEDAPKVFAYFCRSLEHWEPDYLTTQQAAKAWELSVGAIRSHLGTYGQAQHLRRKYNGVIQAPRIGKSSCVNLIPISELKRIHGEFVNEPQPFKRDSPRMFPKLLQFHMLCPVRAANFIGLRWRNYKPDVEGGIIEYLPKHKNLMTGEWVPSEHKIGWHYNVSYIVPLTKNLRAIIEEQRRQQIKDGIEIKPDGFVFVHGSCPTDGWFGAPAGPTGVTAFLHRAVKHLRDEGETIRIVPDGAKMPTVHGVRGATFTTWAKKNDYGDDEINLMLGHIIPAIVENKTNRSYFWGVQLIPERREMMDHYERHIRSLVEPQTNLIELSNRR
jgi:hypothetical protein